MLLDEDIIASRVGIAKLLRRYEKTGTIIRRTGSGRQTVTTTEMKTIVEAKMCKDDESKAEQLHCLLASREYRILKKTVLHCREDLGWIFRGSTYCQLIHAPNKLKRLEWSRTHMLDTFDDVIWTDECSVQLKDFAAESKEKHPDQSQGNHFVLT